MPALAPACSYLKEAQDVAALLRAGSWIGLARHAEDDADYEEWLAFWEREQAPSRG